MANTPLWFVCTLNPRLFLDQSRPDSCIETPADMLEINNDRSHFGSRDEMSKQLMTQHGGQCVRRGGFPHSELTSIFLPSFLLTAANHSWHKLVVLCCVFLEIYVSFFPVFISHSRSGPHNPVAARPPNANQKNHTSAGKTIN